MTSTEIAIARLAALRATVEENCPKLAADAVFMAYFDAILEEAVSVVASGDRLRILAFMERCQAWASSMGGPGRRPRLDA